MKKWFNIQRLQVGPIDFTSPRTHMSDVTWVNQLRQEYPVLLESIT